MLNVKNEVVFTSLLPISIILVNIFCQIQSFFGPVTCVTRSHRTAPVIVGSPYLFCIKGKFLSLPCSKRQISVLAM